MCVEKAIATLVYRVIDGSLFNVTGTAFTHAELEPRRLYFPSLLILVKQVFFGLRYYSLFGALANMTYPNHLWLPEVNGINLLLSLATCDVSEDLNIEQKAFFFLPSSLQGNMAKCFWSHQ